MKTKGIVLAGGTGSRLHPLTKGVSKQLMPVYDKPMIYYPLSTLVGAGIDDILIITTPVDQSAFQKLLGDGSQWGIQLSYAIQEEPKGIAQALIVGREFLGDSAVALILGDNLFHGDCLNEKLRAAMAHRSGATVFGYWVDDPHRYGVIEFDRNSKVISLLEKPENPASNYAVTGLYFYDNQAVSLVEELRPSGRKELEITDLNCLYLEQGELRVVKLGRGTAWLDTGTHDSMLDAANFIRIIEKRQGQKVGCIEEIVFSRGLISPEQLCSLAVELQKSSYGQYLLGLLQLEKEELRWA